MPTFWKSHSNCLSASSPLPPTISFFLELSDVERKRREMLLTSVLYIRQTSAPFSFQFHSRLNKTVCCLCSSPLHQSYRNIKLEYIIFVISTQALFFGSQMIPQFLCGRIFTYSERVLDQFSNIKGTIYTILIYRTPFPITLLEVAGEVVDSISCTEEQSSAHADCFYLHALRTTTTAVPS
jgi:hypothetical protein